MTERVPDFCNNQEKEPLKTPMGNEPIPDDAKQNLADFLKLLVRIDQRIRNELQNAGH